MGRRASQTHVDGVLLLDKPAGRTSNAALQTARRFFGNPKAGHTGTLDPAATGLLPLCFGEAAKFSSALLDEDKTYLATVKLGQTTSTGDAEGTVLATRPVAVDAARTEEVLRRFEGEIRQVPPMYSALKRGGRPLYAYAREGIEVERAERTVRVYEIRLLAIRCDELDILVRCSKGTYIRVLAEDIGRALGCGAHLRTLRRTRVGGFDVGEALSLESLESLTLEGRMACLKPVDSLLQGLPAVVLDDMDAGALGQGQAVSSRGGAPGGKVRVYGAAGRFLGVGEMGVDGRLRPRRLVAAYPAAAPEKPQELLEKTPV
ncbi:MAG: tRNA pseudouridine(55) synthase TruB [Betaproteobacteria bacterium]|nr:tRNA pseudouridine(55) synthase TruB [Betaproteobacteria bacterium]